MNDSNAVDPVFMVHEDLFPQLPRMVEMAKKIRAIVTLGHDWYPEMEIDLPDCRSEFGVICWMEKCDKVEFAMEHPDIAHQERGEGWIFIQFHDDTQAAFIFTNSRQYPQGIPLL